MQLQAKAQNLPLSMPTAWQVTTANKIQHRRSDLIEQFLKDILFATGKVEPNLIQLRLLSALEES
jgi:hypothetical protein